MTPTTELLEVLLKNLSDRIALAILLVSIICFLLMLGPGSVGIWMRAHWMWPFFGALGSVCYLPTKHILQFVEDKETQRKAKKEQGERWRKQLEQVEHQLKRLTPSEKSVLKFYVQNMKKVQYVSWSNIAVPRSLAAAGILVETSTKDGSGAIVFEIGVLAFEYLCAHPDLVGLSQNSN